MPNTLLAATTIGAAIVTPLTTTALQFRKGAARSVLLEAIFLYGAGGTTVDAYVQTTVDGGTTWIDIANFHFTTSAASKMYNLSSLTPVTSIATPGDGALTNNTAVDGIVGSQLRVKYKSSGTYTGATSIAVYVSSDGLSN